MPPLISVVMPVYNTESYLEEAINSILNQSFCNFEFIIVDDCSSDRCVEIIRSFDDPRIILLQNNINQGNYPARNKGMKIARGQYIAVMDSDDVSHPDRLIKQLAYLEANPMIGLVGSWICFFSGEKMQLLTKHEQIKVKLLGMNCIVHPTFFIRKSLIVENNLYYNEHYRYASDYNLLTHAVDCTQLGVIPEYLLTDLLL